MRSEVSSSSAKALPATLPEQGRMARFRQRLFQPRSDAGKAGLPPKSNIGFQASIAEFLLVNRLRARRKAEPSADVLERAARIVFVTCQNWFAKPEQHGTGNRTRL